jgi:Fe-S oxidoreductase
MAPSHSGPIGMIVFITILVLGLGWFARLIYQRARLLTLGKKENRFTPVWARIRSVILYALLQRRLLNEFWAGVMHVFIFWGFCVVSINTATFVAEGFVEGFHFPLLGPGDAPGKAYGLAKDIFEVLVIAGLAIAFYRRLIVRPKRLTYSFEAHLILLFILTLMLTDFVMFGIKLNLGALPADFARWVPISAAAGHLLRGLPAETQQALFAVNYWLHLVVLLVFLNLLPTSKHFHIITSIPNVYFQRMPPKAALAPVNLEDENATSWGLAHLTDLTWKQILDSFSCTECGRCEKFCCAKQTDKPLTHKGINQDIKHHIYAEGPAHLAERRRQAANPASTGEAGEGATQFSPRLIPGDVISEDTLWACTTCGWCEEGCPVLIENIPRIVDMRRYLVLTESRFPKEATAVFKGMENNSNPWAIASNKRQDWADGLKVRWMSEVEDPNQVEWLYYVGCAGSFDDRNKKIARAMVRILDAAGVNYAMLGMEEGCCGDSARRLGNEYLFQALAQANIETFNNYKVKKILTTCPHGYNTLKNEYPQFGGNYQVVHHSEFIRDLIRSGRLRLKPKAAGALTYHDSCYLGRLNGLYRAPREVLEAATGSPIKEMRRHHSESFCCGAGGGRMWLEEHIGTRINRARTTEALELSPDTIASACPFCLIMLDDGVKDKGVEDKVKTLDIAEIVERALDLPSAPATADSPAESSTNTPAAT